MPPKLSNSKMGKLLARMFGQESLALNQGRVELTDEQKAMLAGKFGTDFVAKLEATVFDDNASAEDNTVLFDAAIAGVAAQKDTIISDLQTQLSEMQRTNKVLQADINALVSDPEPSPKATPVDGTASAAPKFKIDMNAAHNAAAMAALKSGNPANFNLAGGIDIVDINNEFKMSIPQGTKLDIFLKRVYNGFPDAKYFTQRLSKGRDYRAMTAIMSEVSQQFTNKWTPKGTVKFTPLEIKYRRHKINVAIDPTEVIDTWLIDMYNQGKTPDQQPLVLYIISNHIVPKILEDITFAMIAKGKYERVENAKDGDEGSAAVKSMDGLETILVEGKKNGAKFNYYKNAKDIRNLKGQELLDYVDAFTKAISPLFANNLPVYCSRDFFEAYKKADFEVYGKYTGQESGNQLRFSKFTLNVMESMYDSPILFATPKANMIELVDLAKPESCINDIQKSNYSVKIFGEYSLSVGFGIAEAVYASVPDGYVPSQAVIAEGSYGDAWEHGTAAAAEVMSDVEGA